MEILNGREAAIAAWLLIGFVYVCSADKMSEVKRSLKTLFEAMFVRVFVVLYFIVFLYTSIMVFLLSQIGFWDFSQLKNTVFWFFSVAVFSIWKLDAVKKELGFFKDSAFNSFKLLAVLQFVVGVYNFGFLVEFLLFPFMIIVGGMWHVAGYDAKHLNIRRVLDVFLLGFGLFTLIYTVYRLVTDFHEFGQEKTLFDFFVPAVLTVLNLPLVFLMMSYSVYDVVFSRLSVTFNDRKLRFVAKLYSIFFINFRFKDLERWSNHISRLEISSHSQLVGTFAHVRKLRRLEISNKTIPASQGWSPYSAKDFLVDEGVVTGDYNLLYDDLWCASSRMYEMEGEFLADNYAYYVEGGECIATSLKVKLNVNDASRASDANAKFAKLSSLLTNKALGVSLTQDLSEALHSGISYQSVLAGKAVSVFRDNWEGHRLNGYDLIFVVAV